MASTVRKLIVEVVDARDLLPKDGHGTCSPYVVLNFYGQKKKTRTVIRDLNPAWNEVLEFNVHKPSASVFGDVLEVDLYHDRNMGPTTRNNFLGRVRLNSQQFVKKGEEALIYYTLEKKTLFSWIQGKIGLKIYFHEEAPPPPPPPPAEEPKPPEPTPPPESQPPPPKEEGGAAADGATSDAQTEPQPEPNQQPPDAQKPGEEPSPTPSQQPANESAPAAEENAASPKAQKPPESDPQPQDGGDNPVDEAPPQPVQLEPPEPEITAFSAAASAINAPRPISRNHLTLSVNFEVDPREGAPIERPSYDLVEKMHYLFVRVVKARSLPTSGNPVVKLVGLGFQVISKPARKTNFFEWDQTFAFRHDSPDSSSIFEISVWDPPVPTSSSEVAGRNFLGGVCFDVSEIPLRDPPDSPLALQWYRLEGGGAHKGNLMLATWIGTQADESFPDAWKTDTAGNPLSRSKVYQSPKLWYLRLTVIEAQDGLQLTSAKETSFHVKAQLGFQVLKTKASVPRNGSTTWNEDLVFVAAEPFSDHEVVLSLENRQQKGTVVLGVTSIPLMTIERRVDDRNVVPRWSTFADPNDKKKAYQGRVQLRVCFDGGYHVMDEAAHVCSDYRPSARQLWKPPVGTVELGIVGCKNLLPMKNIHGKSSTDAYAVAKYCDKWVRTRAVSDSLDPKWNEQYTWKVYDPSTVLTIGVFDSCEVMVMDGSKESTHFDNRIGKVRIRISTLETGKVYRNTYPLLLLSPAGLKKMGEVEVAVRFVRAVPRLDFLHVYSQPLLPLMHHVKPLGMVQQEMLRTVAVKILAVHFSRSEPPLRREVVTYMLDADSHAFSMRKVRANWSRIISVVAGLIDVAKWLEDTRAWKNPTATLLVHALLVMLVWFPDLIVPTFAFYMFAIGAWNYRFRSRAPIPHFDPKISLVESIDREELDEEFDALPSTRSNEVVRARYDKLRVLGARVQTILGDLATQAERVQAVVTWRDPRATGIFVGLCFVVALILYVVPSKMMAMAFGFYYLRHPMFRDRLPSPALNFFRRLPSLSDRIM